MNKHAAHQIMHTTGWLSRQPVDFRNDVLRCTRLTRYSAGEVFYSLDDDPSGMFGLAEGVLEIQLPNGNVATVGTPGYWIGEAAAFKRMPRRATIVAKTDAEVLYLPIADFERLIANAEYCRCFATLTVERLEEALTVISNLMIGNAMQRVCARLLTLSTVENGGSSRIPITQTDLASMCGLSRQSVNKIINRLVQDGVVSSSYGQLTDIDEAKLRRQAFLGEHHNS